MFHESRMLGSVKTKLPFDQLSERYQPLSMANGLKSLMYQVYLFHAVQLRSYNPLQIHVLIIKEGLIKRTCLVQSTA